MAYLQKDILSVCLSVCLSVKHRLIDLHLSSTIAIYFDRILLHYRHPRYSIAHQILYGNTIPCKRWIMIILIIDHDKTLTAPITLSDKGCSENTIILYICWFDFSTYPIFSILFYRIYNLYILLRIRLYPVPHYYRKAMKPTAP